MKVSDKAFKNAWLMTLEKNAYHIWFAATGRQEKDDKCESTLNQPLA